VACVTRKFDNFLARQCAWKVEIDGRCPDSLSQTGTLGFVTPHCGTPRKLSPDPYIIADAFTCTALFVAGNECCLDCCVRLGEASLLDVHRPEKLHMLKSELSLSSSAHSLARISSTFNAAIRAYSCKAQCDRST
jgi:hypothetical protein